MGLLIRKHLTITLLCTMTIPDNFQKWPICDVQLSDPEVQQCLKVKMDLNSRRDDDELCKELELNVDPPGTCETQPAQSLCAICLGSFHHGDLVGLSCNSQCHHQFHQVCISEWLAKKDECPCCRKTFLLSSESP